MLDCSIETGTLVCNTFQTTSFSSGELFKLLGEAEEFGSIAQWSV